MVLKTTQLRIVYCLAENTPVQLTERFQFHVIVVSMWIEGIRDVIQLIVEEFFRDKGKKLWDNLNFFCIHKEQNCI